MDQRPVQEPSHVDAGDAVDVFVVSWIGSGVRENQHSVLRELARGG
jgi:hypothetical protein